MQQLKICGKNFNVHMLLLVISTCNNIKTIMHRVMRISRPIIYHHRQCLVIARSVSKGRPSIDDVERLSRGEGAKRRGVGSREVPHRLNSDERVQFDLAKKRCVLCVVSSVCTVCVQCDM